MISNFTIPQSHSYDHNEFRNVVKRMKKPSIPLPLKSSKYRWENVNNRSETMQSLLHRDVPAIWNEKFLSQHFQSSITPFLSTVSKGWFSQKSCNITCTRSPSFDLKLCCFIDAKYVPKNTISANMLSKKIFSPSPKKVKAINFEFGHSLVKLSKHKLIRKQERSNNVKVPVRKVDSPLLLRTHRKLIRRSGTNPSYSNEIPTIHTVPHVSEEKSNRKLHFRAPIHGPSEKKDIGSVCPTNLVVLTRQKLIRKPQVEVTNEVVEIQHNKLIALNRNKLINSSLLKNNTKLCRSVLYHMIKQRRRPYSRSSYVLLTRNKLIRRAKFKQKLWQKQSIDGKKGMKKSQNDQKPFVSVGKNKLIRKSLFSKRNKITTSKNTEKTSLPFRKAILSRVLSSPSKRIQRFTNHLSRINLKYSYIRGRSAYSTKNKRYLNKGKNNRRIFKKKSEKICPIFTRKGICAKDTKNSCHFVHDPKYVNMCQKFLKGKCESNDCLLSHDLIPQKMPVCLHFLNNTCTFDECPFLHSKPKVEAPLCSQFLRGYCELANECPNWHVYACPEYKSTSSCGKGENCRLPHRNSKYFENNLTDEKTSDDKWRYFEENAVNESGRPSVSIIPGRQTMSALPDFIPL